MEEILPLYGQPYDPLRPVVCFDERPCQLLDEVLTPIPMKPGRINRQDDEYERKGGCCVLIAFEPLRAWRFIQVRMRRTALAYASFLQELVERHYPGIERMRLVQDNLNTPTPGAFYPAFPPQEAFEFAQKFELHSTPITGSWPG
jgi:DDE superfamily endonuclease